MSEPQQEEKCKRCDGTGKVWFKRIVPSGVWIQCKNCGGTGRVKNV